MSGQLALWCPSSDGGIVVFDSQALDLAGSNTGYINCYLAKRGATLHVSLLSGSDFGGFANGSINYRSVVSNDGKWTAFQSAATNIVVGDNNGVSDVFVTPARRTRQTTERNRTR
ncbi:MAG TPA: hypothetical protein VHW01_13830 [Polyangiaceae bacterium]|nr:hypothetical protein [Polyangiaceae bacterium]